VVTPEDLVNLVIAADAERRRMMGMAASRYKPSQRIWIEPFFNAAGTVLGAMIRATPIRLRRRILSWLCLRIGGHTPEILPEFAGDQARAVAAAERLLRLTGQRPAVLILTTHAETLGPHAWLRFELIRQGMEIGDSIVDAGRPRLGRPHSECFLAIDPYALDTVSPIVGGLYAGMMNRLHVVWDRQPSTQSLVQRTIFLRHTGYGGIAWRLLRKLKKGVPMLRVLGGGLPQNARLLYTAREFVQRLKLPRWPRPKRAAEAELMRILMKPEGDIRPPEHGEIPPATLATVEKWLHGLGVGASEAGGLLKGLTDEFKRSVPYRVRLLSVLLSRVAKEGKPMLIVGLSHSAVSPHVRIAPPIGVYRPAAGGIEFFSGPSGAVQPLRDLQAFADVVAQCF